PGDELADALVPLPQDDRDMDRCGLVAEALDWPQADAPLPRRFDDEGARKLREHTAQRIEDDLNREGKLTFTLCTRALQYEALAEEAPQLVQQARLDRAAGAFRTSLEWDTSGS